MRLFIVLAAIFAATAQASTYKITTWNLQWLTMRPAGDPALPTGVLPKTPESLAKLRAYADKLNSDIIAFQEADGPGMAARIFPPDHYQIVMVDGLELQRTGFAIRNGIPFTRNPDLAALNLKNQGLRSGLDITAMLDGRPLRLLGVHLKSGCASAKLTSDDASTACAELHKQIPILQAWIKDRGQDGFMLLGDFNRQLDDQDQMWKSLTRTTDLTLADAGQSSPCWGGGNFIDHLIAGNAARDWLIPGSLRVLTYHEDSSWKNQLSAHCPVSVKLTIK